MIKNKMIVGATISLLFTCLSVPTLDVKAETILTINYQEVSPLADYIEWRYQIINGVLHKRQYNVSTGSWLGKWIPAN